MEITAKIEGLDDTVRALGDLSKATGRNVLRRVLMEAGQPIADKAAGMAPRKRGLLGFSIVVSTQLTRGQRAGAKVNEVEVYIGPAGGLGALFYAVPQEFGTLKMPAHPFMRPAWDSTKGLALNIIATRLGDEVERAADRARRKQSRLVAQRIQAEALSEFVSGA